MVRRRGLRTTLVWALVAIPVIVGLAAYDSIRTVTVSGIADSPQQFPVFRDELAPLCRMGPARFIYLKHGNGRRYTLVISGIIDAEAFHSFAQQNRLGIDTVHSPYWAKRKIEAGIDDMQGIESAFLAEDDHAFGWSRELGQVTFFRRRDSGRFTAEIADSAKE